MPTKGKITGVKKSEVTYFEKWVAFFRGARREPPQCPFFLSEQEHAAIVEKARLAAK